jgi:hypothetical protein
MPSRAEQDGGQSISVSKSCARRAFDEAAKERAPRLDESDITFAKKE